MFGRMGSCLVSLGESSHGRRERDMSGLPGRNDHCRIQSRRQRPPASSYREVIQDTYKDRGLTKNHFIVAIYSPDDSGRIDSFLAGIESEYVTSGRTMNVHYGRPTPLPPGPYVFDCYTGNMYCLRHLYKDTSNAFVSGALQIGGHAVKGVSTATATTNPWRSLVYVHYPSPSPSLSCLTSHGKYHLERKKNR